MQEKRITDPAQVDALRRALRAHLRQAGLSVNRFSKECGVEQSTVHRFVSGQTKTITRQVGTCLRYAKIDVGKCIEQPASVAVDNARLRRALHSALQAHPQATDLLAVVIEGVDAALRTRTRTRTAP